MADPITISILAGTGVAMGATAVVKLIADRRKRKEDEEKRKRLNGQAKNAVKPPEAKLHNEEQKDRNLPLDQIIEEVVGHISFTKKKVQIGEETVGENVIGESFEEVSYPADEIDIRPIANMTEFNNIIPNEKMMPMDLQLMRAAAGESMVQVHMERIPMTELVKEPVYKEIKQAVYLLLDVSPSVFPGHGYGGDWMPPYWRGISLSLLRKARQEDAVFIMRTFAEKVGHKRLANSNETEQDVADFIKSLDCRAGTNITNALNRAIRDFEEDKEEYDEIDIMIITDGQDRSLNPVKMRKALMDANIRLHAILLGVENQRLKKCATIYQEIPSDGWIKAPEWSDIPLAGKQ